jgi:dTMP kinase
MKKTGKFIVFEGIDGSGKSTQIELLANTMRNKGFQVYTTCEPTDGPVGSLIHNIMIGRIKTSNEVIAALFVADRMDHLKNEVNGILNKIEQGITVISDRYYFSSYAYHSIDMSMDWVINANSICAELLKPDLNLFMDISVEESYRRITQNRIDLELFEKKEILCKTKENYFKAFEKLKNDEKIEIINAEQLQEDIQKDIWERVKKIL